MLTVARRLRVAILLLGLSSALEAAGAQGGFGSEKADIGDFTGDIWAIWTSPARMRSRDALAVAATLGSAAVVSRIDSSAYVWMQGHENTFVMKLLTPIREGARLSAYEFGSGQYLLPTSAALYIAGRLSRSANLRDAGLGCAAGHLSSLGLRQVTFRTVSRGRPKVSPSPFKFGVPGSSDWSWQSFYSGHISNSMACASFLTHRYALGIAEPLPYIFSLGIGVGRLADGHHWVSDMVVGAVVGFAVGKALAERQLARKGEPVAPGGAMLQRAPVQIPVMQWSLAF